MRQRLYMQRTRSEVRLTTKQNLDEKAFRERSSHPATRIELASNFSRFNVQYIPFGTYTKKFAMKAGSFVQKTIFWRRRLLLM